MTAKIGTSRAATFDVALSQEGRFDHHMSGQAWLRALLTAARTTAAPSWLCCGLTSPLWPKTDSLARHAASAACWRPAGDWSGEGTVRTSAGSERLRCKAHYDVTSDGTSLEQTLLCASDSYKLEVRSKVAATGTRFAGKWNEVTRDTIGNISGTISSTGIRGKIDGIGFTADLAMSTQANRQSVTIDPTGATDISQVAITLTRI